MTISEVKEVVKQQLDSEPPDELIEIIAEACEGNPLLVLEMCRLLQEGGVADPLESESVQALLDSAQGGPLSQLLIDRRLAALPPLERRLLEHLSMLRRPVQLSLLVSSNGVSEDRLEEALESLDDRGFIRKHLSRGTVRYHIAHEIHMQGLRSAIRPEAARNLQQELGRILAEDPRSQDPVRAFEVHELLAAGADPKRAISYGIIAMRYFAGAYAEPLAIRIGRKMLGFGADIKSSSERDLGSTLEMVEPEDLMHYGLIPEFVGRLPVIGAFFRNTRYERRNRELIMVVTPHLVTPLARGTEIEMPGSEYDDYDPSDSELFLFERGDFDARRRSATGFSR